MSFDAATIDRLIRERRSIYPKQFTGEQIPDDVVLEMLENANWAPNHRHTEPWRFKAFKGDGKGRLLDAMKAHYLESTPEDQVKQRKVDGFQEKKEKTSHVLAIIVEFDPMERIPKVEERMAVACAVQNLYLSMTARGLGGYWSTGNFVFSVAAREFMSLQPNQELLGLFYLGVPFPHPYQSKRGDVADKIEWIEE